MTTNQLTANCNSCGYWARRRSNRGKERATDDCTCLPPAEINDDGNSVCVIPDVASGRGRTGRIYRMIYTATVEETGLSCGGVAKLCVGGVAAQRKGQQTDHVDETAGGRAAGGVSAQCTDVFRSRGKVGVKGGQVGVQCHANPARLVCTEDDVEFDALEVSFVFFEQVAGGFYVFAIALVFLFAIALRFLLWSRITCVGHLDGLHTAC